MNSEKKPKPSKKGYFISIAIMLIFIAVMLNYEKVTETGTAKELFGALSNCFTVPGVIFAGVGGLSFLSKLGAYDSFGYVFSRFSLHNIVGIHVPKQYESYYDYKQKKDEKGRGWLPYVLFVGLASLGIGVILLVVYLVL